MKNISPIWRGNIEEGRLILHNKSSYERYLSSIRGEIELIVRKWKKHRTDNQNKYYWSCVVGIPAEHFGYYSEEMHEVYRLMFLKKEEIGKPATIRSTTSLSTVEFMNYIERCRQWASEQGMIIPDPNEIDVQE